jgi:NitT/TauT family transport system substrate-binding protein
MMVGRREVLRMAGAVGLAAAMPALAAETPPETTRLRLNKTSSLCNASLYVAEELLRAEGFTEIQYYGDQETTTGVPGARALAAGEFDIGQNFAAPLVMALDSGVPIVLIGGVHVGCFELFASQGIRSIVDLKGKTIAMPGVGSIPHTFISSIATSVGLDPRKDIKWVERPYGESKRLFVEDKANAFLAFPPDGLDLRTRRIGNVLLTSTLDRPWSQYFCCLIVANKDFVRRNPVATKRALRALIKANEVCASDPDLAVRAYLRQGFKPNPEMANQAIKELPFGRWRDYNPEETVRFYALRLREAEMVKGAPQKLIAQGTDWRFLNELKKELKT